MLNNAFRKEPDAGKPQVRFLGGAHLAKGVYSTLVLNELERARMQVVLEYLNGNKKINSAIAAELLGVEVKTASRLLSKAEKLEILKGDGKTKNKVYSVL